MPSRMTVPRSPLLAEAVRGFVFRSTLGEPAASGAPPRLNRFPALALCLLERRRSDPSFWVYRL